MAGYPSTVTEYNPYEDANPPFEPFQVQLSVDDLNTAEKTQGKLTAIVRYWTRYS